VYIVSKFYELPSSQGENESFIDDDAGDDVDSDTAAVAFNNSIYTVAQHVYHYYNHLVIN